MSDEITSTILRQIRDDLREVKTDLRAFQEETRGEFSIVNTLMRDAAARAITLSRIISNKLDPAITDLVKRIARIEKKVGT